MTSTNQITTPDYPKETGLAIINSKAPFSSNHGKDALDIALIFGSFEQKVSLFFQGDGVYQLIADQDGSLVSIKDYLKTFSAFEFYDIEDIYVCQQSLVNRQLEEVFHIDGVQVQTSSEFSAALNAHQHVLRF
ncbi:sulfurtransferase complex subunit TusC [Colwellia psychrerythraea]|uniref:Sulfur relay protein TusC/DsrF n=1 Tax=Colwellia psychrerythraea TaxID=28229 RepID=A0A099KCB4_COLPS|nr:sulfurtransferase complex subunit TusC [Colwellia psychrerythraea]KGJ87647.1 sulfur relay protein TusC/DsrF [Colwellia psychrerythraea]